MEEARAAAVVRDLVEEGAKVLSMDATGEVGAAEATAAVVTVVDSTAVTLVEVAAREWASGGERAAAGMMGLVVEEAMEASAAGVG